MPKKASAHLQSSLQCETMGTLSWTTVWLICSLKYNKFPQSTSTSSNTQLQVPESPTHMQNSVSKTFCSPSISTKILLILLTWKFILTGILLMQLEFVKCNLKYTEHPSSCEHEGITGWPHSKFMKTGKHALQEYKEVNKNLTGDTSP